MTDRVFFVSDLHLFSRRSLAGDYHDLLLERAREADRLVLGGDIFDFKWTTLPTIAETIDAAISWLQDLAEHAPGCDFHFLLGNHDHHAVLIEKLQLLQATHENFRWHPFMLRDGDNVYLHGDVADGYTTTERLLVSRQRWAEATKPALIWHWLYDAALQARLHTLASKLVYPRRLVARRLLNYLASEGHGPETGLKHVYFGHTHVGIAHYEYQGVRFHNCGAPLPGIAFAILEAQPAQAAR